MSEVDVYRLGLTAWRPCFESQQRFTAARGAETPDEIWCLEHYPVYTLGLGGRMEHVLAPGAIPVHRADRGGQVTYHGPGQLVVYPLLDLRRLGIGIRDYVARLEQAVIDMLAAAGVGADRRAGAPGVYVAGKKIAALGIRVRRGCCYHGLSLNVDMDLAPFDGIHPCGFPGLDVTQLSEHAPVTTVEEAARRLLPCLARELGFDGWRLRGTRSALPAAAPGSA